jgi:hypothetical protein
VIGLEDVLEGVVALSGQRLNRLLDWLRRLSVFRGAVSSERSTAIVH